MATPTVTVRYFAKDGQMFSEAALYYEVQETLMELSRQAYEAGTSLDFIVIS